MGPHRYEDVIKMGSKAATPSAKTPDDAPAPDRLTTEADEAKADTPAASSQRKTPNGKPAAKRRTGGSKSETAAALKSDLAALERRIDRSEALSRNGIQSLETVLSALQSNLKSATTAQKGQLTRQVNLLTKRLEDQAGQTRAIVRTELKAALAEGGLERFG
ncbi:MAG: hypothetical protein WBF53_12415, partial [Litorimonas sp.]